MRGEFKITDDERVRVLALFHKHNGNLTQKELAKLAKVSEGKARFIISEKFKKR